MNRDELRALALHCRDAMDYCPYFGTHKGDDCTCGRPQSPGMQLARAVLAMLDVPVEVKAAMGRLRLMHDGKGRQAYGQKNIANQVQRDEAMVICHCVPIFLPIAKDDA